MIKKSSFIKGLILVVFTALLSFETQAQQDPQYTQYMYNTLSVNAAYAGQRELLSATALYRTQWVGVEGAPKTITFGIHSPLKKERIGLGLNIVSDQLGPAEETNIDANISYSIPVNESGDLKLSFGLKGGLHFLSTDWNKGNSNAGDVLFNDDINLTSPILGAGLYLHSEKWYLGLSVPNVFNTEHFDAIQSSTGVERLHYFLIGGYVYDLNAKTKLKPAFLVKGISGAPLIADLSVNALFNNKFTLGLAYRWDDSVSGLAGFQINKGLFIGYAYDATTSAFNTNNNGSHEIMLRFELQQIINKIVSPRFF